MALQDPYADPFAPPMDPVLEDALAQQQGGAPVSWEPPPEFWEPWSGNAGESLAPQMPGSAIPGMETRAEAAANTVPNVAPAMPPVQPGLGIPAHVLDGAVATPAPSSGPSELPIPPAADPWASTQPDPWEATRQSADPYATPTSDLSGGELADVYDARQSADPARFAGEMAAQDADARQRALDARIAAQKNDEKWFQANVEARKQAAAAAAQRANQVDAEAQMMSADGGFMASRSSGQVAAMFISAILGGIQSVKTGRPNDAIANINAAIDRHVAAQRAKMTDARSSVSQMYQRLGDDYAASEALRQAAWREVDGRLALEQQNYDPRGTKARLIAEARARARSAIVESQQKYFTAEQKRLTDAAELRLKQLQADHQVLANRQLQQKLAGVGMGVAPATNYGPKEFASVTPPPGFKGTQSAWLEMRNKYQTGLKTEQEVAAGGKVGEEQRQQKLVRGGIGLSDYDANGNRIEFVPSGADTEVTKLRAKKKGTTEMINLLDEAMSLRTGWTSDTVGSDENKQLKAIMGKLKLAAKNTEDLGAITEADAELIKGLIGTDDFTSWRGVDASVAQARRNLINSLRIEAQGQGMSARGASEIDFPNLYAAKAKVSQEEGLYQALLSGKLDDAQKQQALGAIAVAAQSTDPKVNGPARARLRKLAEDAPDEVDRRSIKNWLAMPQMGGGQQ